jgi:DNA-binding LacI/PurR family transcriptional regulator
MTSTKPADAARTADAGRRGGQRTTLKDVAAALHVSPMTVSNAFNRPDRIAPATRDRVLAAALQLGYAGPDPTARSLRRGRAGAVAVLYAGPLSFAFSDPAAVLFLQGVSLATEAGHFGLLLLSGASGEDHRIVSEAAVDGIIAFALPEDDPLLAAALGRRLPLVLVDQTPRPSISRVGIDDEAGARAAAAHLLALGHWRVGVISLRLRGGETRQSGLADAARQATATHPVARPRLRGYAAALAAAGVPWSSVPVYECAATTPGEGAAAAAWLLRREPRPTALLAMSDQLALGVLDAARARGLSVPAELSVVGFDDVPAAARADPGLTTVCQPLLEKGQQAAEVLLASLRSDAAAEPVTIILPTELVVRGSTAPPAALT